MKDFEILTRATPNRPPEVKMQHLKLLCMLLKHEGSFSSSSRLTRCFYSRLSIRLLSFVFPAKKTKDFDLISRAHESVHRAVVAPREVLLEGLH